MSVLRTKSIEQSLADTDEPEYRLKKNLNWLDLTVFGIGVVIGAGIFTLTGRAAGTMAGPSIVLSFVVSAICCALAALCYAEFASTVPVSGSAYTFSYASLGEIIAWIIGWDLMLELLVGASTVAQGWADYLETFVQLLGGTGFHSTVGSFHWLGALLVLGLSVLITIGIKESLRVNMVLVFIKIFIVLFVIIAGLFFVKGVNYHPFVPPSQAGAAVHGLTQPLFQAMLGLQPTAFGVMGIFSGAALVFFAYIGFDVVATTAEEAKRPQRDLPIGIIVSLLVCTVLYCAVCLVITGMVNYKQIDPSAALAQAFKTVGQGWMATLIAAGAVAGLTTVVLTLLTGASRVLFAMSRDNLLPHKLSTLHPRFKTPYIVTAIIGVIGILIAGFIPEDWLSEMVNIGTLTAFILVSIGVIVLRRKRPDLPRAFRVPGVPVVPILAAVICLYLALNLSIETWIRFVVWMAVGFIIYFTYGYRRSRVGRGENMGAPAPASAEG